MTATEAALFDGIGAASRFHVEPGNDRRPTWVDFFNFSLYIALQHEALLQAA
jgi:hypothetical protein